MKETAEREIIYKVPPPNEPLCDTQPSEERQGETALSPELEGAARHQPPKQRRFCRETPHLPAANALIMIKHLNAKSAKSRLTISVQSYARLLSSHYLLSSPSKATFVGGYPLISIIGHTRRDTWRSCEEPWGGRGRPIETSVSRSDLVQHLCVNISSLWWRVLHLVLILSCPH